MSPQAASGPHWTEIDGVTVVWGDGTGPLAAGLLVRAGFADETLSTAGHTHLVEHLALSTVPGAQERQNGWVGGVVTGFVTRGRPEEVTAFLASVCGALTALPEARLEAEKQVLAAEAAAKPYDFVGRLLTWRYGAVGYGLAGLHPLGQQTATADQLRRLTAERFTRANAILWLSGPPPADLRLELPEGAKRETPPLSPVLEELPCWYVDDACGGIAASATVPRTCAATLFSALATRRLRDRLRRDDALSYAPFVGYEPLDRETAHLVLYADSDVERRAELAEGFMAVVDGATDIREADLEEARREILDGWTGSLAPPPEERAARDVQVAAMDWIFGREYESFEARAEELAAVTATEVAELAAAVRRGALFALPGQAMVTESMGSDAPASTALPVTGRVVPSVDAPRRPERLIVGDAGVTILSGYGQDCTVRYDGLAATLTFDDGAVQLIGADAASIAVEPTLWRGGDVLCREILERVPAHLVFPQGARPPETIPQATSTEWQRLLDRLAPARLVLLVLLGALLAAGVYFVTRTPGLAVLTVIAYRWLVWPQLMK